MKLRLAIRASVPGKSNGVILSPVNQVLNGSNAINADPHRLTIRNCCHPNLIHTFFFFYKVRTWADKGNYICIGFCEAFDLLVYNLIIKNENNRKSARCALSKTIASKLINM